MATRKPLTSADRAKLYALEETISKGLKVFWQVGQALETIREKELYRGTHDTFDEYCRAKWKIGAGRSRQLRAAARTMATLAGVGPIAPENERQTRALSELTSDEKQQVWREATADSNGEQPTAAKLSELARAAVAALPPEAQQEEVARAEAEALEQEPPRTVGGDGRRDRLEQIERLTARLRRLVAGIGPDAEAALAHLDQFKTAVQSIDL